MRSPTITLALVAVLTIGWSGSAATQVIASAPAEPAPPRFEQVRSPAPRRGAPQAPPRQGLGYRAYFAVDSTSMVASNTFAAVTGASRFLAFGGGGEVLRVWRDLFIRGSLTRATRSGQRVIILENEDVVDVGVPLEIAITPLEVAAGWRTETGRRRETGLYAGGGLLRVHYAESSEFAAPSENVKQSSAGYVVFGGLDYTVGKAWVIGGEAQYRTVPNAIGQAGASEAFGETNLGGFTVRVIVGLRK